MHWNYLWCLAKKQYYKCLYFLKILLYSGCMVFVGIRQSYWLSIFSVCKSFYFTHCISSTLNQVYSVAMASGWGSEGRSSNPGTSVNLWPQVVKKITKNYSQPGLKTYVMINFAWRLKEKQYKFESKTVVLFNSSVSSCQLSYCMYKILSLLNIPYCPFALW